MASEGAADTSSAPLLQVLADTGFTQWLARHRVSLAVTTYQTCRLLLIGRKPGDRLAVFERLFERPMGLFVEHRDTLWLAGQIQLWRLANVLHEGEQTRDGADGLYVPRQSWVLGELDIHDLVVDAQGAPWFVATALNAIATTSPRYNLRPVWRPPCISDWVTEDRCHLNGLALRDGRPRYVTLTGLSDVEDGWRAQRIDGGALLDMDNQQTLASGLSMPHSPRWHEGRIWLLNAGCGELGYVPAGGGDFRLVARLPGFARGLAFVAHYAVVGLSLPRHGSFEDLPLQKTLEARGETPWCGLAVIDLRHGAMVHWLRFEGIISELFDVQAIVGMTRPTALGFRDDTINRSIYLPPQIS